MNKAIGLQLLAFGAVCIGLSCLVFLLAKPLATPTLIMGLAGGTLCLVAGFRASRGITHKSLALLTLVPLTIVLVSQAVMTWGPGTPEIPDRGKAAATVCLLVILSYGMLMRVAYAGLSPIGKSIVPANEGGTRHEGSHRSPTKSAVGRP